MTLQFFNKLITLEENEGFCDYKEQLVFGLHHTFATCENMEVPSHCRKFSSHIIVARQNKIVSHSATYFELHQCTLWHNCLCCICYHLRSITQLVSCMYNLLMTCLQLYCNSFVTSLQLECDSFATSLQLICDLFATCQWLHCNFSVIHLQLFCGTFATCRICRFQNLQTLDSYKLYKFTNCRNLIIILIKFIT